MTIVEMCVHMDCAGCERKIRRALQKLEGVDNVDVDMERQKVTVTGYVDQKKVLKAVRKTGRRAVLWPQTDNPEYQHYHPAVGHRPTTAVTAHPYAYSAPASSYNYYKHGYDDFNAHGHYYQQPAYSSVIDEKARTMFSDDNTSACVVM